MLPSLATRNSQSVMNRLELMFDLLNFMLLVGIKLFVKSSLKHKMLFLAQLFSSRILKKNSSQINKFMQAVLRMSNGKNSLLEIANFAKVPFSFALAYTNELEKHNLIKRVYEK